MNQFIGEARRVGLEVLGATRKQVERGLELHRDAVVCDAYGFSPRAAIDGDAVRAAMEAGASPAELQDLTEDMRMTRCVSEARERDEFVEAWEAAGVTCIVQNAGEEGNAPLRLLKRLARYTYVVDMLPGFFRRAATPADIVAAKAAGKRCLYMTANGVPLAQTCVSVEEELRFIRPFFQLGCRMMHLTYNRRNLLGDGCAEPADAGLSDFGRAAIAEMNRVGVIVDVAHAGWRTGREAARVSTKPMVASHSGCAAVNAHIRCKPDEVIRAIADTGGYIGICCVPAFLGRTGDLNALLDHLDYAINTFGSDHVAIGTDVAHTSSASTAEERKLPARRPSRGPFEYFWPPGDPLFAPEWRHERQRLSLAWTNWPLFTVGMVQRGHSDGVIRQVLGGNVLRVAEAALEGGLGSGRPDAAGG